MNKELRLQVRNAVCEDCRLGPLTASELDVCVTGSGHYPDPDFAVVTKTPVSNRVRSQLELIFSDLDLDVERILWLSAVKCRVWDVEANKTDLKACREYLQRELDVSRPPFVLTMGNEALFAALNKSGITKYRSRTFQLGETEVMPTIAPQAVERNPGQRAGFMADLTMFSNMVKGVQEGDERPDVVHVMDKRTLKVCANAMRTAEGVSYDIESRSESPSWLVSDPSSVIVSLSITLWYKDGRSAIYAIPLCHPESPFRRSWKKVLKLVSPILCAIPKSVAHNGKYDQKWLHYHGVPVPLTFDTMLAAHLLDENRPKGLKPLAHTLLGVQDWAMETKDLWSESLVEVLEYNGLDTWYAYRLYEEQFKPELLQDKRLAKLFKGLMMPASNEFVDIELRGIWCDRELLHTRWDQCLQTLDEIEGQLYDFVPEQIPYDINWNASNFLRWFLFEHLEMPVLERGKTKDDGSPGNPSVKESVLMVYADRRDDGGEVARLLLKRIEWQKFNVAFFSAYDEIIDDDDRIHSVFKLGGTDTGRLSSGKDNDPDKVTAAKQIRGVNLQQVPRNGFIRGLFGAAPGYSFIQADYSQVELRVAAFIARETNLIRLYQTGQDVHMATAMQMTGKQPASISNEERKKAKAVNFGFLYGMGWETFIDTAWIKYGLRVGEEEAKAFRKAFFDQFPQLLVWHERQRRLARKFKRVQSPMGRIRHLPDIDSPDRGVKAQAERQAINSPVQAMASDMTLLSLVRLQRKFKNLGLDCHALGTVHDAINLECRTEELPVALPLIKDTMERLPLRKMFDIVMDVPIKADVSVGKYWGNARKLTDEEVRHYTYGGVGGEDEYGSKHHGVA